MIEKCFEFQFVCLSVSLFLKICLYCREINICYSDLLYNVFEWIPIAWNLYLEESRIIRIHYCLWVVIVYFTLWKKYFTVWKKYWFAINFIKFIYIIVVRIEVYVKKIRYVVYTSVFRIVQKKFNAPYFLSDI